jgi:cyclase
MTCVMNTYMTTIIKTARSQRLTAMIAPALCLAWLLGNPRPYAAQERATAPAQAPAPPPGYLPPPLDPSGVTLETRRLGDGVYALVANTPFTDNSGFVVGQDAVLVVDSQFNGRMGRQVLDAVRAVTDKPIRYLLNTNAYGDHTFGNYLFPAETRIVATRGTIAALKGTTIGEMRQRMAATVGGDLSVFDGVELRVPDVAFDEEWSVDLGGQRVEARFFGPGMSPNDTVVYVPSARVAWTGNLIFGAGTIPWAQGGRIAAYRQTLDRMAKALDVGTIVPGHGALTTGDTILRYQRYLETVERAAADAVRSGIPIDEFISRAQVSAEFDIAPALVPLMTGFHRWNLQRACLEAGTNR